MVERPIAGEYQKSQLLCTSRLGSWHMARSNGCRIACRFILYSHNSTNAEAQNGIDLLLSLDRHICLRGSMAEHRFLPQT
jgi:hypothetical protein